MEPRGRVSILQQIHDFDGVIALVAYLEEYYCVRYGFEEDSQPYVMLGIYSVMADK